MAEVEVKAVVPESVLKKRMRAEEWELEKNQALDVKKKDRENRKHILSRALQYSKEYETQEKDLIRLKREARLKGGFYVSSEAKLLFIVRIRGYKIVEGEHSLWNVVSQPYSETIRAFLVYFQNQILRHASYYLFQSNNFCFHG